jgi:F0F1-type ATP synthase membrane subunit c/vacuolar-type H+-ATPase subunit K
VRAIIGLWRWRHNPLRRTTDLVEAWLALAALLLVLVAAPLAGAAVGASVQGTLQKAVRDQRKDRHQVTAVVVRKLPRGPLAPDPETPSGRDAHSRVLAHWTAPDGTARRGTVVATLKSPRPGDHFSVWTDRHGRIMGRPLDGATATTHAVLAGFGAAVLSAGLLEAGRRWILWHMVRRRHARWDRAWDKAGPDWGKADTGS